MCVGVGEWECGSGGSEREELREDRRGVGIIIKVCLCVV